MPALTQQIDDFAAHGWQIRFQVNVLADLLDVRQDFGDAVVQVFRPLIGGLAGVLLDSHLALVGLGV